MEHPIDVNEPLLSTPDRSPRTLASPLEGEIPLADPLRRVILTRYSLLGLSEVDTLKQQWTGEVFIELISVLEDHEDTLLKVCGPRGRESKGAQTTGTPEPAQEVRKPSSLCESYPNFPFSTKQRNKKREAKDGDDAEVIHDIFPAVLNNHVGECCAEAWVNRETLSLKWARRHGLRHYKVPVLTTLPGLEEPSLGGGGSTSSAACTHTFREATLGELLLVERWNRAKRRGFQASFRDWLRAELEKLAMDRRPLGDALGALMENEESWQECEEEILNKFQVFSFSLRLRGTFEFVRYALFLDNTPRTPFGRFARPPIPYLTLWRLTKCFASLPPPLPLLSLLTPKAFHLEDFPADIQYPFVDISLTVATNEQSGKWGATFCLPREKGTLALREGQRTLPGTEFKYDTSRVWYSTRGNLYALDWSACASRSEWEVPRVQPSDHWLSNEFASRTRKVYSHQRFTLSVNRISSNVMVNVVLPFFIVTSLTWSCACLDKGSDRLLVISTIFMSAVGLRFVSSTYIPRVSYATFLDQYMWSCIVFVAVAAVVTCMYASPSLQLSLSDSQAWALTAALWILYNAYLFVCFFDHICSRQKWEPWHYLGARDMKTRESEELAGSFAHTLREFHLKTFSWLCCSRRVPLECSFKSCNEEGSRIGSGRILCQKHLAEYTLHSKKGKYRIKQAKQQFPYGGSP